MQSSSGRGLPRPTTRSVLSEQPLNEVDSPSSNSQVRKRRQEGDARIQHMVQASLKRQETLTSTPTTIKPRRLAATTGGKHKRAAKPGTVLALRPSEALLVSHDTAIVATAMQMAARKKDCVLITDDSGVVVGILTAKDLAFRVVGKGLNPGRTLVEDIMTRNPLCTPADANADSALSLMVEKGFRHLPVVDDDSGAVSVLDITKCFYEAMEKLERAYSSSRKLHEALEGVRAELGSNQPQQIVQYVNDIREKLSGPTLESLTNGERPVTVLSRDSVKKAAELMEANHTTAVLVENEGEIVGIFTSKDIVLRVLAVNNKDPNVCSVSSVMTPRPDFAPSSMTIQDALRQMHDRKYLNLPVTDDHNRVIGMVNVLQLTYATLSQIETMHTNGEEGPTWNKFWNSLPDHGSTISGGGESRTAPTRSLMSPDRNVRAGSVLPGDSASHHGADSPSPSGVDHPPSALTFQHQPISFKFKTPLGRTHRLQAIAAEGIEKLAAGIAQKLGREVDSVGGEPVVEEGSLISGFSLSYVDSDGDLVAITADSDLVQLLEVAAALTPGVGGKKVDLFVHHPDNPPILPAEVIPKKVAIEEDEDHVESTVHSKASSRERPINQVNGEQVIAGVPNELLIPGAIAALAFVIVGVFTISRLTSRN